MIILRFVILLILAASSTYSLSISTSINGSYSYGSVTTPAVNGNVKIDNKFSDYIFASLQSGYYTNEAIFDGNGNHALINYTDINGSFAYMPNDSWDFILSPYISVATNFLHPAIALEGKYYGENFFTGVFAGYGYKSYIYPTGNLNITVDNPLGGIYFTYFFNKTLRLNITGKYNLNIFSTTGGYGETIFTGGLTWIPDKIFSLGADILGGFDSANYGMVGVSMNGAVNFLPSFSLIINGDYKYYSVSAASSTTTGGATGPSMHKGGGGGSTATSPRKSMYSTNSSFSDIYVSGGVKYTFSFPEKSQ